ncbi:Tripartite motif-containing protein 59 [Liparis tanakae]|uniref:Tripartite motif-containing protein 59 n=1 Tax=Liparis tanakae TaxID=230148 RepID=A0A4Z2IR94_9TELE|nr:Tripartite motif-containing protein 59 [Liparis tanakae]
MQDREEVNQFFQSLEVVLTRKRHAYLEALDKAGAEVSRAYDPLIHRVKALQEEHLDLVSLGSSVEEEDSPLIFLEQVHLFRERVEEFIQTPLPSLINLSVTPRAAEHLQLHWPAVTIGSLEDAPVPKVCCCARCGGVEAGVETEAGGRDRSDGAGRRPWWELQPALSVVLLVLLLLWFNPVWGPSLGFHLFPQFSQLVRGLSDELATSVWDTAGSASAVVEAAVERWSSHLSSVGEKTCQQLAAFFKNSD